MCPEQPGHVEQIRRCIDRAFAVAEHSDGNEADIAAELRARGELSVSLVALDGDAVVGHVAMSPVCVAGKPSDYYCLAPLSVLPELHRRGIGSQLVRAALDALPLSAAGVVVLGDPAYYSRFGFVASRDIVLPGVPPDYFQVLELGPAGQNGAKIAGEVSFSPAFG